MRLVIVGAGEVGFNLAQVLAPEGHDISIVDLDRARVQRAKDRLDVLVVEGDGKSPKVLEQAGVREAEMLIAVTSNDELNVLCCMLGTRMGTKTNIARVRHHELTAPDAPLKAGHLGIDMIVNPDTLAVLNIVEMLRTPGCLDVADFAGGEVLMRGFRVADGAPIAGRTLAELKEASSASSFLIVAILRGDNLIVPRGDDRVLPGDTIYVLVDKDTFPLFLPMLTRRRTSVDHVVIFGASPVAIQAAAALREVAQDIRLVEPDPERAEAAAAELEDVLVLRGNPAETEVIEEAGVDDCDAFLALSGDDEDNLLASLLARKRGARNAIVLAEEPGYVPILASLDLGTVVNPRLLTVGAILQHVRRGRVMSVAKLKLSNAEIVEFEVEDGAPGADRPLRDVTFPPGSLLGAVVRDGDMMIPDGETVLQAGDNVVAFGLADVIGELERLFGRKRGMFRA